MYAPEPTAQTDGTGLLWLWRAAPKPSLPWHTGASTPPGCHPHRDPQGLSDGQTPSSLPRPPMLRGKAQPPSFPVSALFMSYEFSYVNKGGPAQEGTPSPFSSLSLPLLLPTVSTHFRYVPPPFHTFMNKLYIYSFTSLPARTQLGPPSPSPRLLGLHPTRISSGK